MRWSLAWSVTLAALYVRLCDRMIGPDQTTTDVEPVQTTDVPTLTELAA